MKKYTLLKVLVKLRSETEEDIFNIVKSELLKKSKNIDSLDECALKIVDKILASETLLSYIDILEIASDKLSDIEDRLDAILKIVDHPVMSSFKNLEKQITRI